MKTWQRGIELERLKLIAQGFQTHDGPRCLGAFSKVKENAVANWIAANRIIETPTGAVAARRSKVRQPVKDFRGVAIANLLPNTTVVERVCGSASDIAEAVETVAQFGPVLWKGWADHPVEAEAAQMLGLSRIGSFISASSEIRAIWARDVAVIDEPQHLDTISVHKCGGAIGSPAAAESWPNIVSALWQDHYSSYNKRKSWHAVALRGFGGDATFIEKPAEMSKQWKQDHPSMCELRCTDSPLMDRLPGARSTLDQFQTDTERVRLMRLTGPGGELARHADITDRNAGLADGKIARLHLPIVTTHDAQFTTWDLDNRPSVTHMTDGRWWYLDVRKPHAAVNNSNIDRIHLVVDAVCNEWLRSFIASGDQS